MTEFFVVAGWLCWVAYCLFGPGTLALLGCVVLTHTVSVAWARERAVLERKKKWKRTLARRLAKL